MSKITILGGGNGAHAAAVDLTLRGFEVTLCEDERFASKIQKVFDTKTIEYKGCLGAGTVTLAEVTTDLSAAVKGAEAVLVVVPAFAHEGYAKKLAPIVEDDQVVAVLPGTFGALTFHKEFKAAGKKTPVCETNTLPYATRLLGEASSMIMSRFALKVGVIPATCTEEVMAVMSKLYDNLTATESVIACGLNSLNPIIHVPGCILNAGHIEHTGEPFHYYTEGFSDCVARATEQIDAERCAILQKFGYKNDIVAHEIGGAVKTDSIKEAIAGDPSFAKIAVPPTFKYRYWTEDIPFGLAVWSKVADLAGVETPMMDAMVTLGGSVMQMDCWKNGRSLEELGIAEMDLETLSRYVIEG